MAEDADEREAASRIFQRDWAIYRKMVEHNYLFHREAYATLRNILANEARQPFRFLDIACGDASASMMALGGTAIGHYHGIDLSAQALALAKSELAPLACPKQLDQRDFFDALIARPEPADVVWIGLSLHHFHRPDKLRLMRAARKTVGEDGIFAIYENTLREGETRDEWMARWDRQRADWTAYGPDEWAAIEAHVHTFDLPETDTTWRELGNAAGFGTVRSLYASPTDLFRFYAFTP